MNSTCKKWLAEKGFGFLVNPDGGEDIFVHQSELIGARELQRGQAVTFNVESTLKGLKAKQVTVK